MFFVNLIFVSDDHNTSPSKDVSKPEISFKNLSKNLSKIVEKGDKRSDKKQKNKESEKVI